MYLVIKSHKAPCSRTKLDVFKIHVASVCRPCFCMLLRVVASYCALSQQLPIFYLLCDRRSIAQQCWIRLHCSSNIVGTTHAHYTWFTKSYGLYPSHDTPQVPTLLGVVDSVCTPLPTRAQQLPKLLAQQCRELLRPFARSLRCFQTRLLTKKTSLFTYGKSSIKPPFSTKPPVFIKPPSPSSNGLEINKPPGGFNRGSTVSLYCSLNRDRRARV